jgi:hypothetical protein
MTGIRSCTGEVRPTGAEPIDAGQRPDPPKQGAKGRRKRTQNSTPCGPLGAEAPKAAETESVTLIPPSGVSEAEDLLKVVLPPPRWLPRLIALAS